MSAEWFAQLEWRARLVWGPRGAREAARRGDLLVVVDVLSFATACATAVARGARVVPCPPGEGDAIASRREAHLAVKREEVPARGRFSLSPGTLEGLAAGEELVLPSPNGARCASLGREGAAGVLVGGLVNASATARAIVARLGSNGAVTVVACGERWAEPDPDDGTLRPALEDLLGAGAVLHGLPRAWRSPEAEGAVGAFLHLRGELERALLDCGSGRELVAKGFPDDVRRAARLDALDAVPTLDGEVLA